MRINEDESMWLQSLAMSSLLGELGNNDFLDSIYFKNKVKFGNP